MERQKARKAMLDCLVEHFQCDESDIALDTLNEATTWKSGQDFEARYEVSYEGGRSYKGVARWATVGQEAYL